MRTPGISEARPVALRAVGTESNAGVEAPAVEVLVLEDDRVPKIQATFQLFPDFGFDLLGIALLRSLAVQPAGAALRIVENLDLSAK